MGFLTSLSLSSNPLADSLKNLLRLPRMSPLTMQVLGTLARRNCEIPELVDLVEKDTLLSAGLMQLANSAAFARLQPIHSLRHAVSMIGLGTMRRFALAFSVSNLFSRSKPASTFSLTRFNVHAVATGILAELLADQLPADAREDAFLAGMLHDVGKLLIAVNQPRQYDEILAAVALSRRPLVEIEKEILTVDHAELSAIAIEHWDLAEDVSRAARLHHTPEAPAKRVPLSLIVNKADAYVNYLGLSVLPPLPWAEEAPELEIEGFPFPLAQTLGRFQAEWRNLADMIR